MIDRLIRIVLKLTFPIWIIPFLFYQYIKLFVWAISEGVDEMVNRWGKHDR